MQITKSFKPTWDFISTYSGYLFEEIRLIRSWNDVGYFKDKVAFLFPRLSGTLEEDLTVPRSLQIEPTNFCNVDCICCPTQRSSRKKGFMDLDLFTQIIDQASELKIKLILLYLHGEPLLHPKIVDMVKYVKSKNMAVHLCTNGMRFDDRIAEGILGAGTNYSDYVGFSILGLTKDTYESIMRRSKLDQVIGNIAYFTEARKKAKQNGPVIEVKFYRLKENLAEVNQFMTFWHGKVDHVRLGGNISYSFAEYKNYETSIPPRTKTCKQIWERMTIMWNGDVSICVKDVDGEMVVGNLRENSIAEIFQCDTLKTIREIHRKKQFDQYPYCQNCDI